MIYYNFIPRHMKFILLFLAVFAANQYAQDSLVFIIRVDDIYSRSTTYLPQEITPFQNMVQSKGGRVTWAVMPHRLIESMNFSGRLSKELKQTIAAGHEIAQHGYNHICTKCNQSSHEMYCTTLSSAFTYAEQKQIIEAGMKLLADSVQMVPVSFVPPGHKADSTTYRVMYDKGFEFLSTTLPTRQFVRTGIYNIAPHNEYTWALAPSQFQSALTSALTHIRTTGALNGYYCLLLHDPFIRPAYENSLVINWTGALLDSLNAEYGTRIKYRTLSQAARSFRDPVISSISEETLTPTALTLGQNYPNPFNPETRITFSLSEESHISLEVFNTLGSRMEILAEGIYTSGTHQISFNGNNLPTGMYYYRLTSNGISITRKMLLLR